MASEVAAATPEIPAEAAKQPHQLERKWTFWYDNQSKPKQGAAWGSSLRKVYTFDTVEDFWWYVKLNSSKYLISWKSSLL